MASLDFVVDSFVGSDGSRYYGTLRNGVPSGLGTCIWPNSCHYDGEWRNGVMHGFGTYVWKNGQRYDGEWKDGRREGIGIKTYVDGSMYDGFWRSGKKHGLGVFRPAPEEPNSRRQSNNHGWQSSAGAQAGQQQGGQQGGADGPLEPTGGGMHHVESSQVLAEAEDDAAAQAAAAVAAANAGRGQQTQQMPRVAATTPFAEAAHFLNSEPSVLIDSVHLAGKQQHQERWQPTLAVLTNGDSDAAASLQQRASSLAAAAAEADMPSTSPTNMARAATGASGGDAAAAAAGPGAAAAAAPRKLFVREYDMGQLLREYPLTAEEIKMIFGFLWPKNKVRRRVQRVLRRGPRMQKKLGEVVYKGHYSYSLMLELQLGIRYSVGRALRPRGASAQSSSSAVLLLRSSFALHGLRPWWSMSAGVSGVSCVSGGHTREDEQDERQRRQQQQQRGASEAAVMVADEDVGVLCGQDFRKKAAVYFPSSGSSTTPAHPSMDFMWRDYCPRVFRRLRKAAGIDEADYMLSLAGAQALRQLNSPGKSGSMFLLSEDERFLVKTMRKSEMSVLLGMLEAYSEHMERHPSSLITRFFGLHKVTPAHGRSVRFVVMANIFVTDLQIHRRYDIKGSTDGRTVGPEGRNKAADGDPNIIFKDLDVDMRIVLEQAQHEALLQQLAADSDLLKRVGVMDYSLLLGVHYPARNYTRMSLEPVHSQSLDGIAPQASPLPGGAGASTVPGSGLTSAQGSFLLAEPYSSSAAGAAAGVGGVGGAAGASTRHLTVSDDDVQQPPQLLRLTAQQQAQTHAQQQMQQQVQQQEASNATAGGGAEAPGGLAGGGRSGRSSYEQVPYVPVHFPIGRSSTSEDVQMPPVAAAAFALPPGIGAGSTGGSAFAGGFPGAGYISAAGTAGGAGSAAGSHHGGDRSSMLAGGASAGAAGARNWELWSGAAEQEELLGKVVERMREMGFSEQRMKDVAELARLKILGGKLKKSAARKEPPSAVLQAMQQQRQEAEGALVDGPLGHGALLPVAPSSPDAAAAAAAAALGTPAAAIPPAPLVVRPTLPSHLTSLRGAFTGLGVPFEEDEEAVDTPMALGLPDPKAPAAAAGNAAAGLLGSGRLGINMPAKAVPTVQPLGGSSGGKGGAAAAAGGAAAALDHRLGPEEVVLCFGIIDILQDYSTRKVLERTVKGVTHDKAAISVAPPKQYARRFLDFATRQVFMSEQEYRSSLAHSGYCSSGQADTLAGMQQQQQQLGVAAMQSPWASEGVLYPADAGPVQQGLQQPMQQQEHGQQLKQPSQQQQQQQQLHLAQNGSFGAQMPLVTEDSFPLPPGQLGSEGSGNVLAAPGPAAAAAAAGGIGVVMQQGSAAACPVLPDEQSMLLELLAAPTGMIQLTSGGGGGDAAVDAAAESNGSKYAAAAGQMLSEEQVQVTLQSLGSLDCPAAAAVSNGRQQQLPVGHAAAAAAGEHGDGVLVPAVVVELQGVADKSPASKQGSLERQMEVTAGANGVKGVKGVNGHVVVVNGVGQSS